MNNVVNICQLEPMWSSTVALVQQTTMVLSRELNFTKEKS